MPVEIAKKDRVIEALNGALGWELRAQALYAHYAAYVKGLDMLTLAGHFKAEASESVGHAEKVRGIISDLGGEAITTRDPAPIVHTEDVTTMLEEGLKTEQQAADSYREILPLLKSYDPFYHEVRHILLEELNAVVEMESLLGR